MDKLLAYCLKTKKKEEMLNAEITKNGKRYLARGMSAGGSKLSLIMSEATALKAIDDGIAKKAF